MQKCFQNFIDVQFTLTLSEMIIFSLVLHITLGFRVSLQIWFFVSNPHDV